MCFPKTYWAFAKLVWRSTNAMWVQDMPAATGKVTGWAVDSYCTQNAWQAVSPNRLVTASLTGKAKKSITHLQTVYVSINTQPVCLNFVPSWRPNTTSCMFGFNIVTCLVTSDASKTQNTNLANSLSWLQTQNRHLSPPKCGGLVLGIALHICGKSKNSRIIHSATLTEHSFDVNMPQHTCKHTQRNTPVPPDVAGPWETGKVKPYHTHLLGKYTITHNQEEEGDTHQHSAVSLTQEHVALHSKLPAQQWFMPRWEEVQFLCQYIF